MSHNHSIYDTDMHFLIDPVERSIKNQSKKTILVCGDHNSERFTFEIPRMVEGHDMSLCNLVQIHYLNVNYADIYTVDDLQVYTEDETVVILSWKITNNATQNNGSLYFAVHFLCIDDDGNVLYALRTKPYKEITVADTITNTEAIVEEYPDILAEWEARLTALEENGGGSGGSGIYIGSGEMPDGYNVQIDPEGEATAIFNAGEGIKIDGNTISMNPDDVYIQGELAAWGVIGDTFSYVGLTYADGAFSYTHSDYGTIKYKLFDCCVDFVFRCEKDGETRVYKILEFSNDEMPTVTAIYQNGSYAEKLTFYPDDSITSEEATNGGDYTALENRIAALEAVETLIDESGVLD